uniref:Uncharacterized protein n=1 Tax=Knipowitschia caucasica TaxID=637954 RepID=A0AAV2LKS2_KNICA
MEPASQFRTVQNRPETAGGHQWRVSLWGRPVGEARGQGGGAYGEQRPGAPDQLCSPPHLGVGLANGTGSEGKGPVHTIHHQCQASVHMSPHPKSFCGAGGDRGGFGCLRTMGQ